jgi:hypothetical protein
MSEKLYNHASRNFSRGMGVVDSKCDYITFDVIFIRVTVEGRILIWVIATATPSLHDDYGSSECSN